MNLRHLEIFVAVAECGKMRSAAEQLHISQPSVSQAIRELEEYYGILLFDRLSQRIYLTEIGRQLLPQARHIVDSSQAFHDYAFDVARKDIVRIGASVSVGTRLLPSLVQDFRAQRANLDIRVTVDNTAAIEQMVTNSQVDLAVVEGFVESEELLWENVKEDELVIIVGKGHAFYQKKMIGLEELQGQKLISRETGSMERNQYERYLLEKGIHLQTSWKCSNTETIKQAVQNGEGLAIVSSLLVQEEIKTGSLSILPVEGVQIRRNIKLIYHKNKFFTDTLTAFCELCRKLQNG